ncbi:MAG: hypothetical protein ACHQ4H_08430 [Ktedonobacterales bacterium]|jgi:hypothetical protein
MLSERLVKRLREIEQSAQQLSPEMQNQLAEHIAAALENALWDAQSRDPRHVSAYKAYAQFTRDPGHPGLNFELIDSQARIWSARINGSYRVLGIRDGSEMTWFWIGTHREYEKIFKRG